jgi:hypothetical protein
MAPDTANEKWAVRPGESFTEKMPSADRIGAALHRLVAHDRATPAREHK